jgi:steroid delta-isomerase-like uncharacterized protein
VTTGTEVIVDPIEHNRRVIELYFGELFNEGKIELVSELLSEDYVNRSPGSPTLPTGREGVAIVVRALREAFPDLHYTVLDQLASEDAVWTRTRLTGTHRGSLFGIPASGRAVQVEQVTVERFRDGKIVEHWRLTDDLAMMKQIGVVS